MQKPVPLNGLMGEVAGLVGKGEAAPAPAATLPPRLTAAPAALGAAPALLGPADRLQEPALRLDRHEARPAPTRAAPRVQVALRLRPELYERLCRVSDRLKEPLQAVIEEGLVRLLAEFEARHARLDER